MNFLLSLILLASLGIALFFLLMGRRVYSKPALEVLPLSFFIGAGFTALQFFYYSLLGIKMGFWNCALIPILCLPFLSHYLLYAFKINPAASIPQKEILRWTLLEKTILFFLIFQICRVLLLTWPVPVNSYDALWSYAFKAKIFYFHGGIPDGFFGWDNATVGHVDYPLLLPSLMVWIYRFTGFNDLAVVRIMPAMFMFILSLMYCQLKDLFGRRPALLGVFFIATIPQIANYATIIHADLVLFCYVTSAFLYFAQYLRNSDTRYLFLSSLLFALSLYVKNEAIIFASAFLACALIFLLRSGLTWRRLVNNFLFPLMIIICVGAPWLFFKAVNHIENSDLHFSALTFQGVCKNIKDIPLLLNEFQKQVFGPKKWNVFWVAVIVITAVRFKNLFSQKVFYLALFLMFAVAGYFAAYMCVTGNSLFFYANKTMSRFMIHFAGLFLVLALFLVSEKQAGR